MDILLLNATEVHDLLDPDDLLKALAEGFQNLSQDLIVAPGRSEIAVPDTGVLLTMPAYQANQEIAVKLVSVFHGNTLAGIPDHQALLCLFDAQTGTPLAILNGTGITALRTAGAAALSTRLLARPDSQILTIVGAGVQGAAHLRMLPRVRPFAEIRLVSRDRAHAERLAISDARVRVMQTVEAAVRGADVVCLCTNAGEPVIRCDWLSPGAHVTSVGYRPPGGELDRRTVEQGHVFVETRQAFAPPPVGCGELVEADPQSGTELGEVLLGLRPGRISNEEITVYKAMGHACEDLVAANLVYHCAKQAGIGRMVAL